MVVHPPLALRQSGQDHALEPGRDYLLGSGADCDLVLGATAAAHQAVLHVGAGAIELQDLGGGGRTRRNGIVVERAPVQAGDVLQFGDDELIVVPDLGGALLVPVPALRLAATSRRQRHVRDAAAAMLRRRESESFQELMAEELRRAPWLGLSLALHAVLLLLLWLWLPARTGDDAGPVTIAVDFAAATPPGDPLPPAPDVVVEPLQAAPDPLPSVEPDAADEPAAAVVPEATGGPLRENPRLAVRAPTTGSAGDRGLTTGVQGVGSDGFRQTVAELQKSGLEIVFVFDSTGSMSRTILDTKATIAQMLTVLRALVPDARIGIVTYRDRGKREQYVVRQVPLGSDFWRASNFVQVVSAEGGGDQPEDVRAGLRAAFSQRWRPQARRVVVLAGDAPPHDADRASLLADVRAFARNGRSFVHALVTSPDTAGEETRRAFTDIATAGGGSCMDLKAHEKVLQRVLALAFGSRFEQDIADVVQAVQAAADRVDVASLDLAHRGGADLQRALRREPVSVTLLNALVRRPRRAVALELIDQLERRATPEPTRHAIAWVLQRVFELSVPPVDPESGDPPAPGLADRLRACCDRLPE